MATRVLVVALVACGCRSYAKRTDPAFADFNRGEFDEAIHLYADEDTTGSEFLSGAEAGTAALAGGHWDEAIDEFGNAALYVREVERTAVAAPSKLGELLLTWAFSEKAQSYNGEGYERVMVHACLALAYLARGQLDDARVEVRLANQLLESEEELYETSYAAGGLGHFVSALTYEIQGRFDEAYIDYRRMEEKEVGAPLAGKALVRIGSELGYDDDLAVYSERYGAGSDRPEGAASIVVIAGVGVGPYKEEIIIPIPTPGGLLQWAVPKLRTRPQSVSALELSVTGAEAPVRTVVVEDVSRVAEKNLDDRIGWLVARSTTRAVAKYELTRSLQKNYGGLGRLAGDLFTFFTERADLRSWRTLPDTWQACRAFIPAGRHEIAVDAVGGERQVLGTFELVPGETMIVLARTIGTRIYAYPIGGAPSALTVATEDLSSWRQ